MKSEIEKMLVKQPELDAALEKQSTISDSQSYSDDDDSPLKQTDYRALSHASNIPRTTRWNHSFDQDDYDDGEEDYHEAFPITNFINKFYSDFENRKIRDPDPYFILPQFNDEVVQIPPPTNSTIEKVLIHLMDLPALSTNKKHYIHSWCDLGSVTSVEAKRVITSFFNSEYKRILDPKNWEIKPEITWAKNLNFRSYYKSTQSVNHSIRIFHYEGLGFPPPLKDRIFMRDPAFSRGNYTMLSEIAPTLQPPCMLIFDCDKAAILKPYLTQIQQNKSYYDASSAQTFFSLFSCSENEQLRIASTLPQNFFTCILLSPERAFSEITGIAVADRGMFLQFLDIFTDAIALDMLNPEHFHRLFRCNLTMSTLWRRFLLAQRLMNTFGLHCQSIPVIGDTSEHQLWVQFEYAMRCQLSLKGNGETTTLRMFADLYQKHFIEIQQPPIYVCAFVASLLKIADLKAPVLEILARYMQRSPLNCRQIGKVLDYHLLDEFETTMREPIMKNWCVVMSGLLLVENSLSKIIASSFTRFQDAVRSSLDTRLSEKTRIMLLSILVCLRDSQNHFNCFYNSEQTTDKFLPILFSSSPQIRQWIVLFIHSAMARYAVEPLLIGPTGIHAHATLLMYDKLYITRAVAITILTTIMAPHCPDFNETVMRCAMKGAIDGSSAVRIAFLCCAARYVNLNEDLCDESENEKVSENLMRLDPLIFANSTGKPKLRFLFEMLTKDPNHEVQRIAERLLQDPINSGLEVMYQENATTLHETAHANLFAKDFLRKEMKVRYTSTLFRSNELELFECIRLNDAPVTFVSFNSEHRNVCFGTSNGDIFYGSGDSNHCNNNNSFSCNNISCNNNNNNVNNNNNANNNNSVNNNNNYNSNINNINNNSNNNVNVNNNISSNKINNSNINNSSINNNTINNNTINNNTINNNTINNNCLNNSINNISINNNNSNNNNSWSDHHCDNHWNVGAGPVSHICHLPHNTLAVASADGAVHIFRSSFTGELESFRPSIFHMSGKTVMASSGTTLYVAQEQNRIMVWDIASLLLIGRIETEFRVQQIVCIDDFVYAALINGRVLKISCQKMCIEKLSDRFFGTSFLNMNEYNKNLWTATKEGEVYIWENFDEPRQISNKYTNTLYISISKTLPLIIAIKDKKVFMDNFLTNTTFELQMDKDDGICCCIDDQKPLSAIGYKDGTVAIWRLPV